MHAGHHKTVANFKSVACVHSRRRSKYNRSFFLIFIGCLVYRIKELFLRVVFVICADFTVKINSQYVIIFFPTFSNKVCF